MFIDRFRVVAALGLSVGLMATAPARVARAQDASAVNIAQARELLNRGLATRAKGDARGALSDLKAANALAHTPITGLELGRTYMDVGMLVEAREAFLSIARLPVRPEETARSKAARADGDTLAEQLRTRIPALLVKVTGVPLDSVAVTIDGAIVPSEALAAPRLVDPGTHTVSARSTSGGTAETTVDLREGESSDVELKIAFAGGTPSVTSPAPAGATPIPAGSPLLTPQPETPSRHSLGPLGWSLVGGGVAVGAAGAVLLGLEVGQARDAVGRNDKSGYDGARTLWAVGLAGAIVGAAGLAAGVVVLVATRPSSESSRADSPRLWMSVSPGSLRLDGKF
jgi:hypothetical protein